MLLNIINIINNLTPFILYAPPTLSCPYMYSGLTAISLLIIAVGTGGIKPCVAAFGGDQFGKDKIDLLPVFFSVFYFSINAGSVLSTILTPILRSNYLLQYYMTTCT